MVTEPHNATIDASVDMDDISDEVESSQMFSFFYPVSSSEFPDPPGVATRVLQYLQSDPLAAAAATTELSELLIHSAHKRPHHIDRLLQATQLLLSNDSLPLINNWDSSRPNTPFSEMFHVAFRDDLNDHIRGRIDPSMRESYIAASLLAGRVRSVGLLTTPEIVGSLAEGLKLPDESLYHYQGELAEIAATASCLQLLGGYSVLLRQQPTRFSKEVVLTALDQCAGDGNRTLVEFTKHHLEQEPITDMPVEQIVEIARSLGCLLGT